MGDALKSAMTKNKVDLVLQPGATVSYQPAVDITNAVVTELNTLVPTAQVVPPAGREPGQQPQQQAAPASTTQGQEESVTDGIETVDVARETPELRAEEGGEAGRFP